MSETQEVTSETREVTMRDADVTPGPVTSEKKDVTVLTKKDGTPLSPLAQRLGKYAAPKEQSGEIPGRGRPPGSLDKQAIAGRTFARTFSRRILESDWYAKSVETRLKAGELPPAIEALLWQYAYGKPKENVDVDIKVRAGEIRGMSREELEAKARQIVRDLQAQRDAEEAARIEGQAMDAELVSETLVSAPEVPGE